MVPKNEEILLDVETKMTVSPYDSQTPNQTKKKLSQIFSIVTESPRNVIIYIISFAGARKWAQDLPCLT